MIDPCRLVATGDAAAPGRLGTAPAVPDAMPPGIDRRRGGATLPATDRRRRAAHRDMTKAASEEAAFVTG